MKGQFTRLNPYKETAEFKDGGIKVRVSTDARAFAGKAIEFRAGQGGPEKEEEDAMRKETTPRITSGRPTEDEIRDYAYHLYVQSGCVPGRDMDHWLEAETCLLANIPKEHAHTRLHRHIHLR